MTISKIHDRDDVVKNEESAAVLAADFDAYQNHLAKRKASRDQVRRIADLELRVAILEQLINKISIDNGGA